VDFTGISGMGPQYYEPDRNSTQIENKLQNIGKAGGADEKELKQLDSVSRDLESLFIYMLMKEMRKTVQETKLIDGGKGEEIFRDMLDEEMSKKMAAAPQGIGIAKMVYDQLSRPILAKIKAEQAQNVQGTAAPEPEKK
jgi:peptidoglycan hydrolase FlgJ